MKKVGSVVTVIVLLFTCCVAAADISSDLKKAFDAKNPTEVAQYCRKAAEQGLAEAQLNFGFLYEFGQGVSKSYKWAYVWLNIAAAYLQGEEREKAIRARDTVEKKLTPEQLAEVQKISAEWEPR